VLHLASLVQRHYGWWVSGGVKPLHKPLQNTPKSILLLSSEGSFGINQTKEYYIMSKAIVVSYSQFAFGLGKQGRLLRESSLVWHTEYVQADSATRKERLHEWLVQHLQGGLDVTQQVAERILSKPRTERSKLHNNAYSKAYSDYRYHIIRPETKKDSATVSAKVDEAEACLKMFYAMSKKDQARFDMLRAKDGKGSK
jgi:hypothetical protein